MKYSGIRIAFVGSRTHACLAFVLFFINIYFFLVLFICSIERLSLIGGCHVNARANETKDGGKMVRVKKIYL